MVLFDNRRRDIPNSVFISSIYYAFNALLLPIQNHQKIKQFHRSDRRKHYF